ncbi:MAG: RdgB/HAM1 family non-canonical purine NTP pyrophosphatase [Chitinivibrionales bacterium]
MVQKLIAATGNRGKIKEIREILSDLDLEVCGLEKEFGYKPDIPESGTIFSENAGIKAEWVRERRDGFVIADDSGLIVDSLGGAPGVYSSRYAGEECDDQRNIEKLLSDMRGIEERDARFKCVICLKGNGVEEYFEGVCEGRIAETPSGTGGFGYDPVFIPEGLSESFAEIDPGLKNRISHRSRALNSFRSRLDALL